MLKLDQVCFSYGEKQILKDFSLTLQAGERIALMAPSGRGKTTLLRLMAGLEAPSKGTIQGIPTQGVAMVFQENRLLPQLTVLDNLKLIVPRKSTVDLLKLLNALGLEGEANRYPSALSGGMKRRVAIGRALTFDSPLILLDEPFAGLDAAIREQTAQTILQYTTGRMMAAVTHDPYEAQLLHARVVDVLQQISE